MLVALPLVIATTAGALAASPGTMPFNTAAIRWILDAGTLESVESRQGLPADYQPTSVLYHFCLPPGDSETNTQASGTFEIAPDGKMTGICHATRTTTGADGTYDTVKDGTLTGQYDLAAQTITFHFEGTTQEVYTPPATCNGANCGPIPYVYGIVIDGPVTGGEVIGDRADGTARHTFTCSAAAGVCFIAQQVATGAFFFEFMPPLPSQGPAPGGGTGGGTSDSNFILLLILAGASAAIIAAATWWRRGRKPRGGTGAARPSGVAGAVGSDRSGGFEDRTEYGEGAHTAAPAASGAYEALVVAQGQQGDADEPLVNPPDSHPDTLVEDLPNAADEADALPVAGDAVGKQPAELPDPRASGTAGAKTPEEAIQDEAASIIDAVGDTATTPAGTPPPPAAAATPPSPPKPGQPGTLNLEGEGWAGTHSDSPDDFAEGWIGSTGVIGSPGSARPAPPPAGSTPAPSEPPPKPRTPPKPGEPGTLNLEGEGWAGTHSDSPDDFAQGWIGSTGVIGSPGSVRPPPPPPEEQKTPEQAIKDEAANIIDAVDPDAPKV
jgi:hypothetical protein